MDDVPAYMCSVLKNLTYLFLGAFSNVDLLVKNFSSRFTRTLFNFTWFVLNVFSVIMVFHYPLEKMLSRKKTSDFLTWNRHLQIMLWYWSLFHRFMSFKIARLFHLVEGWGCYFLLKNCHLVLLNKRTFENKMVCDRKFPTMALLESVRSWSSLLHNIIVFKFRKNQQQGPNFFQWKRLWMKESVSLAFLTNCVLMANGEGFIPTTTLLQVCKFLSPSKAALVSLWCQSYLSC